jgi:hypothetical protein
MIKPVNNIFVRVTMLVIFLIGVSCDKVSELSVKDYVVYVDSEKSNLSKTKTINSIKYKVKLITPELMVLGNEKIKDQTEFLEKCKGYNEQMNFTFIIEDDKDSKDFAVKDALIESETYSNIMQYANSEMVRDIYLITDSDTIRCSLLHLEPANSVQPVFRFSLGFTGLKHKIKECTLCINDELFNNGCIKFNYSESTFNNLPKVKV